MMRLSNTFLILNNIIKNENTILLHLNNIQRRNLSMEKLASLKDSLKLDKIKELRDQIQLRIKDDKVSLESKEKVLEKLSRKGTEINNWYMKVIGLDQVKLLQDRVLTMQSQLSKAQEARRDLDTQLKEKRVHLNKIQEQINKINRYQDSSSGLKYMELVQEEMKEISLEKELSIQFEKADKKERELFTGFCIAIRDSHDKERSQAEYTKYFGIILSIFGTIVGSMLTLIINSVRTRDLLSGIEEVLGNQMQIKDEKIEKLDSDVKTLDLHIQTLAAKITSFQNKPIPSKINESTQVTHLPNVSQKEQSQWPQVLYLPEVSQALQSQNWYTDKKVILGVAATSLVVLKLFGF